MQSQPTDSRKFLHWILEPALAANLAFACVGALLGHIANNEARENQFDDSTYIFLRAVFRIADMLHISSSNPVATAVVARNFNYSSKLVFVEEAFIVILTFAIAALILPLQRRLLGAFRNGAFVAWYAGATALFAMPALNLAVMVHDKGWYDPHGLSIAQPDRIHFFVAVFVGELIGVAILIAVSRWRVLSLSVLFVLSILHCAFWMRAFWPRFATYLGDPKSPSILFFCFPILADEGELVRQLYLSCFHVVGWFGGLTSGFDGVKALYPRCKGKNRQRQKQILRFAPG